MSKSNLTRSARDRAVRQISADMQRDASAMASAIFERHGRRLAEVHPRMRSRSAIQAFERAWLGAVGK